MTLRLCFAVFLLSASLLHAAVRPNIPFIPADDLGIANVSCKGADNFTRPHIDAPAHTGIRYTHADVTPLCGPTRALILTGRYAVRAGAVNQDQTGEIKPSEEIMMPKILKPAGNVTSCIGKWGRFPLGPPIAASTITSNSPAVALTGTRRTRAGPTN
jgi:arylsulfatase